MVMLSTKPPSQCWAERYYELQVQSRNSELKGFYAEGMVAEGTPISAAPLVAMDFETTGLDPSKDEIVSVGLTPFSLERIYCRDAAHWVVKPRRPLQKESVVVHGITHSEVHDSPDLSAILPQLLAALAGKIVVVHFRQIERAFLNNALQRRIGEGIEFAIIDTHALECRALIARQGIVGRLLRRPLGSTRLADCRQRYGLPHYPPHQAQTDALATAELLQAQVAYHYRPDTAVADLWC
ncbi:MAG: 3'-5' exonuclease [Motiliproteus sp.]